MSDKPKLREGQQNHWLVIFKTAKVMKKKNFERQTRKSQNNMKNKQPDWRRLKIQDNETKCLILDANQEKRYSIGEVWIRS